MRYYGSVESEPITYFGGRDSNDHGVPLYFGGGFSGVVPMLTMAHKMTTPISIPIHTPKDQLVLLVYRMQPSTSYAILDCNALLAFFRHCYVKSA